MAEQGKEPALHNEALEAAIKAFKANQTNENLIRIMGYLEKAAVMQPAMLPPNVNQQKIQDLVRKSQGGKIPVKAEKQAQPRPVILKNDRGEQFFAVFTGKEQIPPGQKYPAMIFLPFRGCSRMAVKEELKLSGIVLNPFTDNLVLHKAALDMLNRKEAQIIAEDRIARDELSKRFHEDRQGFMDKIGSEKGSFVLELYQEAYLAERGAGSVFPYKKEDFDIIILNISDTLHMVRIGLAEDGSVKGTCLCASCCYNPQTGEGIYYLIQKGAPKQKNRLLTVDEHGVCAELGEAPEEGSELYDLMGRVPWAEQA